MALGGDLPDLIARRADLNPDAVALEEAAGGRVLTYAELDRRAGCAASVLADRGVREGDRVAILCRNRIAFWELLFACAKLGAILVPLNWRMPPAELAALVADCAPSLLVCGGEDERAASALPVSPLRLDGEYEALLARAKPLAGRGEWPGGGIWYLLYTSGTTGRPKGVIYTYRMALANHVNIAAATGLTASDTTLNFLPHFHTAGINLHSLPTLFAGGRVLILPGFEADQVIGLIEAGEVDAFFAVPTVYHALVEHPRFAAAVLAGRVRHWGCGGAPLSEGVLAAARGAGVALCNGMGMTETGPTMFLQHPSDCLERPGSVGKPQLLCRARIVDEALRDVPRGEVGELLFAGPGITPGYWMNAEATRAAFTADGWLRSGDLGRQDEAGFFYVAGRRKEMFISGGENVYPAEVENVLAAHPAIIEAAVVGAPDARWGEVGRAFIQVAEGAAAPDPAQLDAFCRARLAAYKVPRSFAVVAEFPRTAAGKVQKHLLTLPSEAEEERLAPAR